MTSDKEYSSVENRTLSKAPKEFSSLIELRDYFFNGKFESYLSDQISFRDNMISTLSWFNYYVLNKKEFGKIIIGKDDYIYHKARFADKELSQLELEIINENIEQIKRISPGSMIT